MTKPAQQTMLAQIVAIHTGVAADTGRAFTDLHHKVQRAELVNGLTRSYRPFDEDEREQRPPETKRVQVRATETVAEVQRVLTRLLDVTATKDRTNCDARADIIVDGQPLATDVPVTYLLWLEKKLIEVRAFITKLPVLDPAENWHLDEGAGIYRSEPVFTRATAKALKTVVKWEPPSPDYKQAAQTDTYAEDVPVGRWHLVKFSGALPEQARAEMLARVTKLLEAVRYARETANRTVVVDVKVGGALLGYVFAGV